MEKDKEEQLPLNKQEQESSELQKNPDRSDILGDARQVDQLKRLHPDTEDPEIERDRKSRRKQVGSSPLTDVDKGDMRFQHSL